MSARTSIVKALAEKLRTINGSSPFTSNLQSTNVVTRLRFWDEVSDFPYVCVVAGSEHREYLPSAFKWGILNIALKLYTWGEDPSTSLENLITDIEYLITQNEVLEYSTGKFTTEILISSIVTDEGLLNPYGVGEINLSVRYQLDQ